MFSPMTSVKGAMTTKAPWVAWQACRGSAAESRKEGIYGHYKKEHSQRRHCSSEIRSRCKPSEKRIHRPDHASFGNPRSLRKSQHLRPFCRLASGGDDDVDPLHTRRS